MPAATKTVRKVRYKPQDNLTGYALLAPWLIGFFAMWLVLAVISIYYSFTDYNLLSAPGWVGFKNYIDIFTTDKNFRKAMAVTSAGNVKSWTC